LKSCFVASFLFVRSWKGKNYIDWTNLPETKIKSFYPLFYKVFLNWNFELKNWTFFWIFLINLCWIWEVSKRNYQYLKVDQFEFLIRRQNWLINLHLIQQQFSVRLSSRSLTIVREAFARMFNSVQRKNKVSKLFFIWKENDRDEKIQQKEINLL